MKNSLANEIIKGAISLGNSTISGVVQALITTLFLRKNTSTEEFEKIKANKFGDVINDLLDNGKMTYLEYYKCNNFIDIAKIADERITNNYSEDKNKNHTYDIDWFVHFYEYASNISNDDMQSLWASILEREVTNPNSVSLTLLNTLSLMSKDQAIFFCRLSRFVFHDIDCVTPLPLIFVSTNREAYKKSNITPSTLKTMERFGLIECDFSSEYVFFNKKKLRKGNNQITVYGDPNNYNKIKCGNVTFTQDGETLYSIVDDSYKKYREDIFDFVLNKFKKRNCQIIVNDKEIL